ncbi:MAG: hypothetical protein WBR18_13250 [Anaerolineales bacterium]
MRVATDWQKTVDRLEAFFAEQDLAVIRSFDLQTARGRIQDPASCPCPYHGSERCTCQYIVLLVYDGEAEPASIVVHGHDRWTQIAIEEQAESQARDWLSQLPELFRVAQGDRPA